MRNPTRLRVHVRRGSLSAVNKNEDGKALRVQVDADGIARDDIEVVQEYGFASLPKGKAEVLFGSVEGQTGHVIVLGFADRRYRIAVAEGEVCLYDDQGQRVHLTRDGIAVTPKAGAWVKVNGDDVRLGTDADAALVRWPELKAYLASLSLSVTGTLGPDGASVTGTATGAPELPQSAGTSKVKAK